MASDCAACDFMTTLAYGGGTWVATGVSQGDGFVEASSDGGKTWKASSPAAPGSQEPLGAAAYGDGHWIALGQAAFPSKAAVEYTSTDGAHWSPVAASGLPSDDISAVDWHWNSVTFGGGTWVALATECAGTCHDSLMFTSTDGTHWHQSDHSFNDEAVAAYGNGLWIVAANRGRGVGVDASSEPDSAAVVSTSPDLQRWAKTSAPAFGEAIAYGNGTWLLAAYSGQSGDGSSRIFSSTDGHTWSPASTIDGQLVAFAFAGSA